MTGRSRRRCEDACVCQPLPNPCLRRPCTAACAAECGLPIGCRRPVQFLLRATNSVTSALMRCDRLLALLTDVLPAVPTMRQHETVFQNLSEFPWVAGLRRQADHALRGHGERLRQFRGRGGGRKVPGALQTTTVRNKSVLESWSHEPGLAPVDSCVHVASCALRYMYQTPACLPADLMHRQCEEAPRRSPA